MEIFLIKNALLQYKHLLKHFEYNDTETCLPRITVLQYGTKDTYQLQISHIFIKPNLKIIESRPELATTTREDINISMRNKVKHMKDRKFAEFNYKIITNTLTNTAYLSKWLKNTSPECSLCNVTEDIIHMLYDCRINKDLWEMVGKILNTRITLRRLILCHISYPVTYCITLIAYSIYKYWLFKFNKNEIKCKRGFYLFIRAEIENYLNILRINKHHIEATYIANITHEIERYISSHYDPG